MATPGQLPADAPSAEALRVLLTAHRGMLENAEYHEFVDVGFALQLHHKLATVLDRWDSFDRDEMDQVVDTVCYFVEPGDEEHDLLSPIGFVDDAEKVDDLLQRIAPDLLS